MPESSNSQTQDDMAMDNNFDPQWEVSYFQQMCKTHLPNFPDVIQNLIASYAVTNIDVYQGEWHACFGNHGIEVLEAKFGNEYFELEKITGDPNVPAGEVSVRFRPDPNIRIGRTTQGQQKLRATRDITLGDKGFMWSDVTIHFINEDTLVSDNTMIGLAQVFRRGRMESQSDDFFMDNRYMAESLEDLVL